MASAKPRPKQPKPTAYPFAYYGEGSARPIREKDGLLALVVLAKPATTEELRAIASSAPAPMRTFVKTGKRWVSLETSDVLDRDIRAWAKASGDAPVKTAGAAYDRLAAALDTWIRGVHQAHPVGLFFVGSDGKFGPWHADTVARFGERVRPLLDVLRAEKAGVAHAEWIARSFLRSGATRSYADVRALAEDDPPGFAGEIHQRYDFARPLVDALGTASLAALGPYGELGFWACAPARELAPDPAAHAKHLAKLAAACPAKRRPAAKLLLVAAAARMLGEEARGRGKKPPDPATLAAAIAVAQTARTLGALEIGFLETMVDAARAFGGGATAVAMAKLFAEDTFATVSSTPTSLEDEESLGRVATLRKLLEKDLKKFPDAKLEALLATAPVAEPEEKAIEGAKRPHLARLDETRLSVRYRGSVEDQVVSIAVRGSPRLDEGAYYVNAVEHLIAFVNAGLAGGTSFAPELGEATLLSGSQRNAAGPDFAWKVRVKGVAPELWAVALNELAGADDMTDFVGVKSVKHCPRHIEITGELLPDGSAPSATTKDVLLWLKDPAAIYAPWADLPFEVRERKAAAKPYATFKPVQMSKAVQSFVKEHYWAFHMLFDAHPKGGDANRMANWEAGKTQAKVTFGELSCPAKIARGPLLNFARRLHVRAAPLASVELALG